MQNTVPIAVRSRVLSGLIYAVLALLVLGPVVWDPFTQYIGLPGDPQQFMWYLGWFWHAVLGGHSPFHTQLINAPVGQNLMWNTSILAESAAFGWLCTLTSGAFVYNLLWFLNAVASCLIGEAGLRHFGVRLWLSRLGGCLFGFLPYTTAQSLYHLHLWMTSILFAILYILIRLLTRSVTRPALWGIALGVFTAAEFYTSLEVLVTFAAMAVIGGLFWALTYRSRLFRQLRALPWGGLCLGVCVALVLMSPGIRELFYGPNRPTGKLLPSEAYVNDLLNFILPTPVYWIHTAYTAAISHRYTGNYWENNGYLGVFGLCLFVWATGRLLKYRAAFVMACTFVMIALLSMGPSIHIAGRVTHVKMPWLLMMRVPLINSALPSRLMLFGDILLVGLLIWALEDRCRGIWRTADALKLPIGSVRTGPALQRHRLRRFPFGSTVLTASVTAMCLTWLPKIPYDHSVTPPAQAALLPGGVLYPKLHGHITLVLSSDVPDIMQALGAGGYGIAMANPYGYTGVQPARAEAYAKIRTALQGNVKPEFAAAILRKNLSAMKADRVLFYPVHSGEKLLPVVYDTLVLALGPPTGESDGAMVWQTPQGGH